MIVELSDREILTAERCELLAMILQRVTQGVFVRIEGNKVKLVIEGKEGPST